MKILCLLYPPDHGSEQVAALIIYKDGTSAAIEALENAKKWLLMTGEYRLVEKSIPNCIVYINAENYMAVILTVNSYVEYSDFIGWLWELLKGTLNLDADNFHSTQPTT